MVSWDCRDPGSCMKACCVSDGLVNILSIVCQLVVVDVMSWVKVRCCWSARIPSMSIECMAHVVDVLNDISLVVDIAGFFILIATTTSVFRICRRLS